MRCTGCGDCTRVCAPGVLALVGERLEFVNPESCDYCGECEAVCSQGAISCPYDIVLDANGRGRVPSPGASSVARHQPQPEADRPPADEGWGIDTA